VLLVPYAGDRLEENLNPIGRMYYAASAMACTPNSLSQEVGLGLGAQARRLIDLDFRNEAAIDGLSPGSVAWRLIWGCMALTAHQPRSCSSKASGRIYDQRANPRTDHAPFSGSVLPCHLRNHSYSPNQERRQRAGRLDLQYRAHSVA
jgi:hypothetical protein